MRQTKYIISLLFTILLFNNATRADVPLQPQKTYGTIGLTLTDEYGKYGVDKKGNIWYLMKKHPNEKWELIINPEFEQVKDETFCKGPVSQVFTADFIKFVQRVQDMALEADKKALEAKTDVEFALRLAGESHQKIREAVEESRELSRVIKQSKEKNAKLFKILSRSN